jgi:mannose-6-phosphate isomerase-like protein (cupin superfamily)
MIKLSKIHSDNRGSIKSLLGKELLPYPEVTLFHTKKGFARGGCIHSVSSEHICVLAGEIDFFYTENETQLTMKAGDSFTIPPVTPHYFVALQDSVVLEWGPQMSEKGERHLGFRAKVDAINNG